MFHTRVNAGELGRRLDAGFYNPEYVAAQAALARFPLRTMESLRAEGAPIGYGVVKPRFQESSVRMVRIQDFIDPFVDLESSASIDPAQMTEFKRSACQSGDLLVAIGGYPGRLGLLPGLPDGVSGVNINQHVVRVRFAPGVDRYFVTAFLMSSSGGRILARQVSGSVQAGINVEDFRLITVPIIDADAQRYIGDKIRQAERLRLRARRLEAAVRAEYRRELDRLGYREVPHRKSYRARLRDRLDPAYYDPAFTTVLDSPWLTRHSEPLSRFFTDGSYGDLPDSASYGTGSKWLLRATDLDECMTHWDAGLRVPSAEVGAKSEVKENDLLLEVKGAIEKCAIGRGPAVGKHVNGTVFRLSPIAIHAGYLCLHLTAEVKRKYAAREAVNNIIQYLHLDCIRALPVLRLDREVEASLGDRFLDAIDARTAATSLTTAATTLIEHLIAGRIAEADLVAAQKALDGGDRSADREIFKAVRQGDAPDAKPLISGLDALYTLLDAQEGEAV